MASAASASTAIQAPKGTQDILPADAAKWQAIERVAREVAGLYHFEEIRTPIFEHSELFHRGVGETTDIVSKETYTFNDRDNRSLTLRPEGTAGVVRAVIEAGLLNDQGARAKVFYLGPNFRYEKPQKGRYRQHHQFGVEAFGVAEGDQDAECILLQMDFYRRAGLKDLALRINSLGDAKSKQRYRDALVQFLAPKQAKLSDESKRRLGDNPLRILDSKDPRDIEAVQGAPPAAEYLSEASTAHFKRVRTLLESAAVPFSVDGNLVRGFDYYTGVVWEVTAGGLGAQNAVGGGGRYDNLVEMLGGRPTPGVGFGCGLERLLIALEAQQVAIPTQERPLVWLIAHGDAAKDFNWTLMRELRAAGIRADMDMSGRSVKNQFKVAERASAAYCVIVGESELASNTVMLKDLARREQTAIPRDQLTAHLLKSSS
ncbi:MAG: histidyl-tRNA synthetase [Humisphaera sp.]|nr:histidyl-tRNA synthetase [Humisphaera sp.]